MVENHGVIVHENWPEEIWQGGANAAKELLGKKKKKTRKDFWKAATR